MSFRFSASDIIFFIASLAYLAAEFLFNAMMLDVAGDISAAPQEIERVKDFGRIVSASGFTLLTLGLFSRNKFRLTRWRDWLLVCIVFSFCLTPALAIFSGVANVGFDEETFLTILPIAGLVLALFSAGRLRVYVIVAVILMAWPAMFAGQRIFIEYYAVDKTSWQERAEARNVLMLRASLEECTVDLGNRWLCGEKDPSPALRAVRAMITALWMHDSAAVIADLGERKDQIVEDMALKGVWFSPRLMYGRYVRKVTEDYQRYEAEMTEKYYIPYRKASDLYLASTDEEALQREADKAVWDIERGIDRSWDEYRAGVRRYNGALAGAGMEALQRIAPVGRMMDDYCANNNCPERPDTGDIVEKAQKKARIGFIKSSGGYTPDIQSREEFIAHAKTQEKIKESVELAIRDRTEDAQFQLPDDWFYEPYSFKDMLKDMVREKARTDWEKSFSGKVEPGLEKEAFFKRLNQEPPVLEDIIMSEEEFIRTQVLPTNSEMIDSVLQEMKAEAPLYENGQILEEKGKNYIRAAYIPAVALVLSLVIVLLTLARGIAAGIHLLEEHGRFFPQVEMPSVVMRMGVMAVVVLFIIVGPYLGNNAYTSAEAYRKYLGFARERNVVTASVLDWAVHMQPFIYGPGGAIRSAGEKAVE